MKKMRRRITLAILAVVAILIIVGRDRIRYNALAWLVTHQTTPGETSMREMVGSAPDPVVALTRLWNSNKLCQREFVLNYLREQAITIYMPRYWPAMRSIALEAAFSGDAELQLAALVILEDRKDPDLLSIAMTLVNDVDPGVRSLGTGILLRTQDKKYTPVFAKMLTDPDHGVRVDAAGALKTLNDADTKITYDLDDTKSGQDAVDYWKKWWTEHEKEYASNTLPTPGAVSISNLGPAPDFSLPDLQGNHVTMKELRGKPVLLVFWATWCKPCIKEIPDIEEFQKKHGSEVTVLGISVDNLKDAETGKTHVNGSDTELSDRVSQFAKEKNMDYRILMDNKGEALGPYSGGDLPVAIFVDSDGIMRRRFLGSRTTDCLERMLQDTLQPAGSKGS